MFLFFGSSIHYYMLHIIAALLPAVFLMRYIYKKDKYEKEPAVLLWRLIVSGLMAAFLAMILEMVVISYILPSFRITNQVFYHIAVGSCVAIIEEGSKMYFLKRRTWNDPNFNFRYDGVVYAVFVSLGFAAIENVLYVIQYGLSVAVSRGLLAVPAHTGFAVFMGAYYGTAKLREIRGDFSGKMRNLFLAFAVSAALHAYYDITAMIGEPVSVAMFIVFVIIMYVIVYRKISLESAQDVELY